MLLVLCPTISSERNSKPFFAFGVRTLGQLGLCSWLDWLHATLAFGWVCWERGRASKQAAQSFKAPTLALAALAALATGALDGSRSCGKATPVVECGISDSGLTSTLGSCESDEASYHWQRFRAKLPGGGFCSITRAVWGNVQRLDELPADDGPDAVHGILLQLSTRDFAKLCQIEYEYRTTELNVESYDGRVIAAQAFVSPAEWKLPTNVAPPERILEAYSRRLQGDGH